MPEFKLQEVTIKKTQIPFGDFKETEMLIGTVTIKDEARILNFDYHDHLDLYRNTSDEVYVQIPQWGTDRSHTMNMHSTYFNKVRRAYLYIQKINEEFKLITRYKVLTGHATITTWIDSLKEPNPLEIANDSLVPIPEKYSINPKE